MRVESARVTVTSPLSVVNTTEFPVIDFTVPTALANPVCASAKIDTMRNKAHFETNPLQINLAFWRKLFMDSLIIIEPCEGIKVGKELSNSFKSARNAEKAMHAH
jgi:hypothetical protein